MGSKKGTSRRSRSSGRYGASGPKRIPTLWKGGSITVTPIIWSHYLRQAQKEKAWALRTEKDKAWLASASEMSKEMLADRLRKSVDELARYHIQYTHYRASLGDKNRPYDPHARREWVALGGTLRPEARRSR
jgi:hypothetical protein